MDTFCIIITAQDNGTRLDVFLKEYFNYGTRAVRRLLKEYPVTLNGKKARTSAVLATDDVITCTFPKQEENETPPLILGENEDFFALYKKENIHSVSISGKIDSSVEEQFKKTHSYYNLCNRLDFQTSGILVVAKTKGAYQYFRALEKSKGLEKQYYALVHGICTEEKICNSIDMENKQKSIVLDTINGDSSRHTLCKVVRSTIHIETIAENLSLLQCTIYKGARHQIRCHLAHIGNPIVGDTLYGNDTIETLFLHNSSVDIEGVVFTAPLPDFWKDIPSS